MLAYLKAFVAYLKANVTVFSKSAVASIVARPPAAAAVCKAP
jgi:hypothetical protein